MTLQVLESAAQAFCRISFTWFLPAVPVGAIVCTALMGSRPLVILAPHVAHAPLAAARGAVRHEVCVGWGLMQGSGVPAHSLTTALPPFLIKENHWPKKHWQLHVFNLLWGRGRSLLIFFLFYFLDEKKNADYNCSGLS